MSNASDVGKNNLNFGNASRNTMTKARYSTNKNSVTEMQNNNSSSYQSVKSSENINKESKYFKNSATNTNGKLPSEILQTPQMSQKDQKEIQNAKKESKVVLQTKLKQQKVKIKLESGKHIDNYNQVAYPELGPNTSKPGKSKKITFGASKYLNTSGSFENNQDSGWNTRMQTESLNNGTFESDSQNHIVNSSFGHKEDNERGLSIGLHRHKYGQNVSGQFDFGSPFRNQQHQTILTSSNTSPRQKMPHINNAQKMTRRMPVAQSMTLRNSPRHQKAAEMPSIKTIEQRSRQRLSMTQANFAFKPQSKSKVKALGMSTGRQFVAFQGVNLGTDRYRGQYHQEGLEPIDLTRLTKNRMGAILSKESDTSIPSSIQHLVAHKTNLRSKLNVESQISRNSNFTGEKMTGLTQSMDITDKNQSNPRMIQTKLPVINPAEARTSSRSSNITHNREEKTRGYNQNKEGTIEKIRENTPRGRSRDSFGKKSPQEQMSTQGIKEKRGDKMSSRNDKTESRGAYNFNEIEALNHSGSLHIKVDQSLSSLENLTFNKPQHANRGNQQQQRDIYIQESTLDQVSLQKELDNVLNVDYSSAEPALNVMNSAYLSSVTSSFNYVPRAVQKEEDPGMMKDWIETKDEQQQEEEKSDDDLFGPQTPVHIRELRKTQKPRILHDDREHALVIDATEDVEAKTRARDADNRKNHMHRHFGMAGIIRAGGEPPDVEVPDLPAPRDTDASALSGSPRERDEHPQKRQQSPASIRSIDELPTAPNTESKFHIKKKFKGARQTNKPGVALREMSRQEKAAVVERLVMEGSIEQVQIMQYAANKVQMDLQSHVERLQDPVNKAPKLRNEFSSPYKKESKEQKQLRERREIKTKAFSSDPKPFVLPSVQQVRLALDSELPLPHFKPTHPGPAEINQTIEASLEMITRRLGFVNKKLQLQHKVHLMIREMAEQGPTQMRDHSSPVHSPTESEIEEEEDLLMKLPPREISSKQMMREKKEQAMKVFSHKSATMSQIDALIQSPRLSKELKQSLKDKRYDGLQTFYDNRVKEMLEDETAAGTTQVTFLTAPQRPIKGFRDGIREKFNRTQDMQNMEKYQKRAKEFNDLQQSGILGGFGTPGSPSINFENLDQGDEVVHDDQELKLEGTATATVESFENQQRSAESLHRYLNTMTNTGSNFNNSKSKLDPLASATAFNPGYWQKRKLEKKVTNDHILLQVQKKQHERLDQEQKDQTMRSAKLQSLAMTDKSLMAYSKRSQIQRDHHDMLSSLNLNINSVDLSDALRMHQERLDGAKFTYKLDKKAAAKKEKAKREKAESSQRDNVSIGKKSRAQPSSPSRKDSASVAGSIKPGSIKTRMFKNDSKTGSKQGAALLTQQSSTQSMHSSRSLKSVKSGEKDIKGWNNKPNSLSPMPKGQKSLNPLTLTVIKDDALHSDISEEQYDEDAFEEVMWAHLDLLRGADPTQNHLTGTIAEQVTAIRTKINEEYDLHRAATLKNKQKKQQEMQRDQLEELLSYLEPHVRALLTSEDSDPETMEYYMNQAIQERSKSKVAKKKDEQEKQLAKMDRQGGMNASDIINLMNDDKLVERYTKHLNNIIFKYHYPFIKKKYQAWIELTDPNRTLSFFERMKLDKIEREKRQQERLDEEKARQQANQESKVLGTSPSSIPDKVTAKQLDLITQVDSRMPLSHTRNIELSLTHSYSNDNN